MLIASNQIHRPIREGSEIELNIRIDASRLITVEAFVPELNQHFSDRVYVPQREEHDYSELVKSLPNQIGAHIERINNLETSVELDEADSKELERVRREIEDIDIVVRRRAASQSTEDPDEAKQLVEASRDTRIRLSRLEQKAGANTWRLTQVKEAEAVASEALDVVERLGSLHEKREIAILQKQMERAISKGDERGLRKTAEALDSLRWRVLFNQDWFWREIFDLMSQPGHQFLTEAEAAKWLAHGAQAIRDGDGERLREAVRELWKLQPKTEVEKDRESVVRSGLRRY
jgi:hypothetical protein